jgi:hypothetical protein
MSLINDALKRAKLAQQQAAATSVPVLQLRPVEPAPPQATWRVPGLLLPVAMAGVALFALLFVWQLFHRSSSPGVVAAKARTPLVEKKLAATAVPAPVVPQMVVQSTTPTQPNPPAQPATVISPPPSPTALEPKATPEAPNNAVAINAAPLVTDVPAPDPPPLKLQSIIYNPRRPSALISGRIVFLGDKFGSQRVVAITKTSVKLASGGYTNVLDLPE